MPGRLGRPFAAAGVLVALLGLGLAPAPAAADSADSPPRSVVATGRAQGFRGTYTVPDYVIVSEFFDGGGPVTESVADSTGRATSFSSLPWPGENAVTAPGTLSAASGRSVPVAYPFHVRADYPTTPSAEVHDPTGAYAISAVAAADRSAAAGAFQGGSGVSGSRAQTSAVLDDGGVVRVLAETADTGLSIGEGLLRIAAVRSRSETTLGATDAEPVTHSQLVIEGATVAGHPVTIDADGVHAADHEVAAPIGRGVSSDNELLGQAGITATVVPTGRPGSANALVITSRQATPAPNNPKGTLVLRVGGASSEIVVGSADLPPAGPAAEGGPPGEQSSAPLLDTPDATGPSPSRSADRVAAGSLADDPPPAGVSGAGLSADLSAEGPSVSAAPLGASPEPTAARPARLRAGAAAGVRPALVVPDLATTGALFSLLAMGGLGLLLATRLHRLKVMKVRG